MVFRAGLLASTTLLGLALLPSQAYADLLGAGKTVQAFYYNGVFASPEGEIPVGAGTSDPAPLNSPVVYTEGSADGSLISIGSTQIIITNLISGAPFCTANAVGTACPDVIDGFDFKFTGENILGVSVDPASAADFRPVTGSFQGNTHLGLQLISPNEIRVDVTGDEPALNDRLVLDASFTPVTTTPEPHTLPFLCGILGLGLLIRRVFWRGGQAALDRPAGR